MIISLLVALVAVQAPTLTSADAGAITRTVASYLIPPDKPVGNHPVVGRTVAFDQQQTIRAFKPLLEKLEPRDIMLTLPALLMTRDSAITCVRSTRDCTVSHDAIFIAIDAVDRKGVAAGQYRVSATLRWAETTKAGHSELRGGDYTLVVGLSGGKYKQWRVLRSVRKPID